VVDQTDDVNHDDDDDDEDDDDDDDDDETALDNVRTPSTSTAKC